jgi:hypothetical protein
MLSAIGQSGGEAGQCQPTFQANELGGFYVAAAVVHSTLRTSMTAETNLPIISIAGLLSHTSQIITGNGAKGATVKDFVVSP